ncbi:MAG TPA: hypothetical protein VER55_15175, partial [Ardenticatenaceae bacterium]|nr:hypothetical protein [Ardenticatenaceae bacterium]
ESEQMEGSARPGMILIQADGRHDLLDPTNDNRGDTGDPFPGTAGVTELGDTGSISTTFPDGPASGVFLRNIVHDPLTKEISLDVEIEV